MISLLETECGKIYVFDVVDSTNDVARRMILYGFEKPIFSVAANRQLHGRGVSGAWQSPHGGFYMSCAVAFKGTNDDLALRSARAVKLCLEGKFNVQKDLIQLLPPNDLTIHEKKLGGVLVEIINSVEDIVIIGIGINVLSAPTNISGEKYLGAISLNDVGISIDLAEMRKEIFRSVANIELAVNRINSI